MSNEYQLTTPISTTNYAGGTKVSKRIVAGNTGRAEYKRLEKTITPSPTSKLGKMGIKQIEVSKDLIGNNFRGKLVSFFVDDPKLKALLGDTFKITDTKEIKKFLKTMQEVKKSNSNLAGYELLQFVSKLCKIR